MTNVIELFKKKQDKIAKTEPLTDQEIEAFKAVLLQSVASYHTLNPMEKFALYSENVKLIFILMDLIDGTYVDKGEKV